MRLLPDLSVVLHGAWREEDGSLGEKDRGLAISSVLAQLPAHVGTEGEGCRVTLLGLLFRAAVEQEGFPWLYIFVWFNYRLPLVLTCLGSEVT